MLPVVILAIEDESDRAFMTQIYLDHERIMYAEMLKMSDNRGIMDDVFQESLIRLIDKIDVLRRLDERKRVNYIIWVSALISRPQNVDKVPLMVHCLR